MQMLYNSDSYALVLFEVPSLADAADAAHAPLSAGKGGYEIVDKFAGKQIYISGLLADSFKTGVEELIRSHPSEDEVDAFLERFSALMQQPLVLH